MLLDMMVRKSLARQPSNCVRWMGQRAVDEHGEAAHLYGTFWCRKRFGPRSDGPTDNRRESPLYIDKIV